MKAIIALLLCALLAFGWITVAKAMLGTTAEYNSYVENGQSSFEACLYEQAAENFQKALAIKDSDLSLYTAIKVAYRAYYNEQGTASAKDKYMTALETCCEVFPEDPQNYEEIIRIYYDAKQYNRANTYAHMALQNGALTDYIREVGTTIKYMYRTSLCNFTDYDYSLRGKYTVTDGSEYWVADTNGKKLSEYYGFAGPLSAKGTAIYKDSAGFSVRDGNQISRLKLSFVIEDSGYFADGLCPVKVNGVWFYINEKGEDSGIGSYAFAANFHNGKAAVCKDGKWGILTADGSYAVSPQYDGIALDMYGRHTGGMLYALQSGGQYTLVTPAGEIGKVADIDIATDGDWFAYKDANGLWGYKNSKGETVIEPAFVEAKGFSNGYGAVKNADGLWGFVNEKGALCVDYTFSDAGYFLADESCIVQVDGRCAVLTFTYR